jgi:acetyl esterase/lipase
MAKTMIRFMKGKYRSGLKYEQEYIPRVDGSRLRVCVYSPLSPSTNVPGLLWIHGGGYALGTPEQDELFINFVTSGSFGFSRHLYRWTRLSPALETVMCIVV